MWPFAFSARADPFFPFGPTDVAQLRREIQTLKLSSEWVIPPSVRDKAESVLFYVLGKDSQKPEGCGFFISATLALTVSHARNSCSDGDIINVRMLDGAKLTLTIRHDDGDGGSNLMPGKSNLDFMVLENTRGAPRPNFFPITRLTSPASLVGNKHVALLAGGIALADELATTEHGPLVSLSLTITPASVSNAGARHFVYGSSWDGDSGGCLFFNGDGAVVGIHLEGVNRARELLEHAKDLADVSAAGMSDGIRELLSPPLSPPERPTIERDSKRLKPALEELRFGAIEGGIRTVSASIRDIVSHVTTGGLALFLGCKEVQNAVAAFGSD